MNLSALVFQESSGKRALPCLLAIETRLVKTSHGHKEIQIRSLASGHWKLEFTSGGNLEAPEEHLKACRQHLAACCHNRTLLVSWAQVPKGNGFTFHFAEGG